MSANHKKFISDNMLQKSDEFPKIYDNLDTENLEIILNSKPELLNKRNEKAGYTLLFRAVLNGNYKVVEFLLEKNADPNIQSICGDTPLHHAVENSNHKLINLLLEKGANPNIQQMDGETAMHIAAVKGDYKVIKLLKLYEGNVTIRTKLGYLPIDYALESGNQKCIEVLRDLMEKHRTKSFNQKTNTSIVNNTNMNDDYFRNDDHNGFQTTKNSDSPINRLKNNICMSPDYLAVHQNNTSKNSRNPDIYNPRMNSVNNQFYSLDIMRNLSPGISNSRKYSISPILQHRYSNNTLINRTNNENSRNRVRFDSNITHLSNKYDELNRHLIELSNSESRAQEDTNRTDSNYIYQMKKFLKNDFLKNGTRNKRNSNSNIEASANTNNNDSNDDSHFTQNTNSTNSIFKPNSNKQEAIYNYVNNKNINLNKFNNARQSGYNSNSLPSYLNYANLINSYNNKKSQVIYQDNNLRSITNRNEESTRYGGSSHLGSLNDNYQQNYNLTSTKHINNAVEVNHFALNIDKNRMITLRDDEYKEAQFDNYRFFENGHEDSRFTDNTQYRNENGLIYDSNEEIYNLPRRIDHLQSNNNYAISQSKVSSMFYSDLEIKDKTKNKLYETFDEFSAVLAVFFSTKNDIDENYIKTSREENNFLGTPMRSSIYYNEGRESVRSRKHEDLFNFNLKEMNEFIMYTEQQKFDENEEEEEEDEENDEEILVLDKIDVSDSRIENSPNPYNYTFKNKSQNTFSPVKRINTKNFHIPISQITMNSCNSHNIKYFSKSNRSIKDEFKQMSIDTRNLNGVSLTIHQKVPDSGKIVSNETLENMNLNFKREASCQMEFEYNTTEATKEINSFLTTLELENYTSLFIKNGFDDLKLIVDQMKCNMAITDQILKDIGIPLPGHRAKILLKLEEECNNFGFALPPNVYYNIPDNFLKLNGDYLMDQNLSSLNSWLSHLKLDQFTNNFIKNGYHSLELLFMQMNSKNVLTEKILEEDVGINKIGYRIRIINKLIDDSKLYVAKLQNSHLKFNDIKDANQESCKCIIY